MAPAAAAERPAVFLDRDGVLNEDLAYVYRVEDLRILPGVPAALAELKKRGYLLLVVSNQSGVARGMYTEADVGTFHVALNDALVKAGGVALDGFYFCPHLPDGTVPAYTRTCDCRKPGDGMVRQAAADHGVALAKSFLVGDKFSDVECAVRAGVRGIQVTRPDEAKHPAALAYVRTLAEAVAHVPRQ